MARRLRQGVEPEIAGRPDLYRLRAIDVVSPIDDFDALFARHESELGMAVV